MNVDDESSYQFDEEDLEEFQALEEMDDRTRTQRIIPRMSSPILRARVNLSLIPEGS